MISHVESFPGYNLTALRRLYGTSIPASGIPGATTAPDNNGYVFRALGATKPVLKFLNKNKATGTSAATLVLGFKIAVNKGDDGELVRIYEQGSSNLLAEVQTELDTGAGTTFRLKVRPAGGTWTTTNYNYSADATLYRVQLKCVFALIGGSIDLQVNEATPAGWSAISGNTTGEAVAPNPPWGDIWITCQYDETLEDSYFDLSHVFMLDGRAASSGMTTANTFLTAPWGCLAVVASAESPTNTSFSPVNTTSRLEAVQDFDDGGECDFDAGYVQGQGSGSKQSFVFPSFPSIVNKEDIIGWTLEMDVKSTESGGTQIKVQRQMQATAQDSVEGAVTITNTDWQRKSFVFESPTGTGAITDPNSGEYGIEIQ